MRGTTPCYPDALAVAQGDKGLGGEAAETWAREEARKIATDKGCVCPQGVYAEPYDTYALALYPS